PPREPRLRPRPAAAARPPGEQPRAEFLFVGRPAAERPGARLHAGSGSPHRRRQRRLLRRPRALDAPRRAGARQYLLERPARTESVAGRMTETARVDYTPGGVSFQLENRQASCRSGGGETMRRFAFLLLTLA